MDVLVIGAGPTGLLLAGDLADSGGNVTLVERCDHESNLSRAFSIHARTMEELDARGLADELLALAHRSGRCIRSAASASTSPAFAHAFRSC
ncbi:FAD-dependent oxidoreductase [Streptomyces fodineus]|uniref:FAD-dependent oxidoreductase n=1 Tax=Streptomyces fodineus TaxID=1904616 RepID=UPI001D05C214